MMRGARAERSKSVCFIHCPVAQVISVVAHEHDDRIVVQAQALERVEQAADVRVEERESTRSRRGWLRADPPR
jgi:hypothetical protein